MILKELRQHIKTADAEKETETPSDQDAGEPVPPIQKAVPLNSRLIDLVQPKDFTIGRMPFIDAVRNRISRRRFSSEPLSLEELSFLLWSTQGVKNVFGQGTSTKRTVPSAGARHPFETYLVIDRVEGLHSGLYRYVSHGHALLFLRTIDNQEQIVSDVAQGQTFVGDCAAAFFWTAIPYRTEWRYPLRAHRFILIEVGHICQNLYLAAEAIGCGTCAVGAYDQKKIDMLLGVDGDDEFTVYLAAVGKRIATSNED